MFPRAIGMMLATTLVASAAQADSVWLGRLAYSDCQITKVKDCRIEFSLAAGRRISGKMKDVSRVEITGETQLNEAEKQLTELKRPGQAATTYAAILAKGAFPVSKPWMERLVVHRLLAASDAAGQIDTAVRAWLIIMDANKASEEAIALRPKLPTKNTSAVGAAISLLAGREKSDSVAYRNAVNPYRMQLLQLAGRNEEAANLAMIISRNATPVEGAQQSSNRAAYVAKIAAAEQFLKVNKPQQASGVLAPMMNAFTDLELPRALMALGRAQLAMAQAASGQQKNTLLCESALNFMRVQVAGGAGPQERAAAMVMAGRVNESFGPPNKIAASKCYRKVLQDEALKDTPAAAEARALLDRLK